MEAQKVSDKDKNSSESVSTTCNMMSVDLEETSYTETQGLTRLPWSSLVLKEKKYKPKQNEFCTRHSHSPPSPSVSFISEIDNHHSTDTDTSGNDWIIGGVMLDNNMLSLVDCLTYSVKIIDVNSNTFISCINLPTRPWNITRVEREQVVVLCDNKLVFIKVGRTLSVVKEVDIKDDCCCIVYTNNTLIVSFLNPGSVKILDLDGHILKIISTDDKGQNMFEEPCHIALSLNKKILYVSDERKHSVTSMDLNGTVHDVYTHDRLISPRSLAVDRDGYIYIAGQGSYNMHIISPFCKTIRIFDELTWGINSPYEIICCKSDNKLYISHFQGLGNPVSKVSAYQIEW